ncbi:MAG: hypothetical protein AB1792_02715 [Candidatus Zixiibacteriota bacterium]
MSVLPTLLRVAHLIGLALGLGAATAKLVLVLKCRRDPSCIPVYHRVAKPITRQIVLGLVILAVSGIGWLLIGYGFSTLLIVKIVLVAAMFVVGPIIDNVVEPRFHKLAPVSVTAPSPEFREVQQQHLASRWRRQRCSMRSSRLACLLRGVGNRQEQPHLWKRTGEQGR